MKRYITLFCVLALSLNIAACDDDDDAGDDEQEEAAEEEPQNLVELGDLGVRADVPEEADVDDVIVGTEGVTIMGMGVSVNVVPADTAMAPVDFEEAKAEAEEEHNAENLEAEELDDGWIITFDNETSLGDTYWVQSYREVAGQEIMCETSIGYEIQRDGSEDLCRSIQE